MGYEITDEFVSEWNRVRSKVDSAVGPGLHNTPTSLAHSAPPQAKKQGQLPAIARVKIVEAISDDGTATVGRYNANLVFGNTNNDPGDTLAASDLGTVGSTTVEVWNISEIKDTAGVLGSPALTVGRCLWAVLSGGNSNSGAPIYQVQWEAPGAIVVTIGSHDTSGGNYQGQIHTTNDAQVQNLAEASSSAWWLPSGIQVIGVFAGYTTDSPPRSIIKIDRLPNNPFVACAITDDGSGTNGSYSTTATYKYNVKDLAGNTIGTSLSPLKQRTNGYVKQASGTPNYGSGFWTGGTFNLWDANEVLDVGSCPIDDDDD